MKMLRYLLELDPTAVSFVDEAGELPIQKIYRSRDDQEFKFRLYQILIEVGMKHGLGEERAGLLRRKITGRFPLQSIVGLGGRKALEYLMDFEPPLLVSNDVVEFSLVDELLFVMHTGIWSDNVFDVAVGALRVLFEMNAHAVNSATIKLLPEVLKKATEVGYDDADEIILLFVQAGLRSNLGGEHGIGGLFMPGTTSDFLIEEIGQHQDQGFSSLMAHLSNVLEEHSAPILHVAMKSQYLHQSLDAFIQNCRWCVLMRDGTGRIPLHLALENGVEWVADRDSWSDGDWDNEDWDCESSNKVRSGVIGLLTAEPSTVSIIDPITGLYPFMLAVAGGKAQLDVGYMLLRACPTLLCNNL